MRIKHILYCTVVIIIIIIIKQATLYLFFYTIDYRNEMQHIETYLIYDCRSSVGDVISLCDWIAACKCKERTYIMDGDGGYM